MFVEINGKNYTFILRFAILFTFFSFYLLFVM